MPFESLFSAIQKAALPAVWSRGVALSRETPPTVDKKTDAEILLRIHSPQKSVSPRVTLWPEEEDWYCDCGDRNDPCVHVVASVVALKNNVLQESKTDTRSFGRIRYRFFALSDSLHLKRTVVRDAREEQLTERLVALIGGQSSGRLSGPPISATQQDFSLDQLLSLSQTELKPENLVFVFRHLEGHPEVFFDDKPVQVQPKPVPGRIRIDPHPDNGSEFLIRWNWDPSPLTIFKNGAALIVGAAGERLAPFLPPSFTAEERTFFASNPLKGSRLIVFCSEILPELTKRFAFEDLPPDFPKTVEIEPEIDIRTERLGQAGDPTLVATGRIVYGRPPQGPFGWLTEEGLKISGNTIPIRDKGAEFSLVNRLRHDFHLSVNHPTRFQGEAALDFAKKLRHQTQNRESSLAEFAVVGELSPQLHFRNDRLEVSFSVSGHKTQIPFDQVWDSWRSNPATHIPLSSGGWASLPQDWLTRFGRQARRLLALRDTNGCLPRRHWPEAQTFTQDSCLPVPHPLLELKNRLENRSLLSQAILPADLTVPLRPYQKEGVHWLGFLAQQEMGALLADDMGLGKTLQALAMIRPQKETDGKPALVICPTSVIVAWEDQIRAFRPGLSFNIYHGPRRKLDFGQIQSDMVVTSYGILRSEVEAFSAVEWDTTIVDEAQTIRNPSSLVSQAVRRIRSRNKIALTGTPIENHLLDLWSIFDFINPNVLGSRADFEADFARPIQDGNAEQTRVLQSRIRPFILRRTKDRVATDLPPKTDLVLHAELSDFERDIYQTILAATKEEVLHLLEENPQVNMMTLFEALLRIRQICCHPSLVPGFCSESSSKTDLLLDALETAIEEGHRCLVFSQWTSYLDLLEPHLRQRKIGFLRLDGTTRDRPQIIHQFQEEANAATLPLMLISLKAGGLGLTLTAADHVFIADPWWNPAVEEQAAGRAHRIGQTKPVFVHRIIAKDTIEERILLLQKEKRALAEAFLSEQLVSRAMSKEQILELLTDNDRN